jgi:hypothetical protein
MEGSDSLVLPPVTAGPASSASDFDDRDDRHRDADGRPGLGLGDDRSGAPCRLPGIFAGIVEIAGAGLCLVNDMTALRRRLLIWHQEAQEPTTV